MIDYLFCALTPADAIADPALAAYVTAEGWRLDVVNLGLQVWSDAGDTTSTATDEFGNSQTVTVHAYLPGFWLTVSAATRSADLEASPLLILGADRDGAAAGEPRETFVLALGPGQSLAMFTGMHVSPLMAGAGYPFG
jgi:hypothetical protein